nr:glycosyltransferase family 4 protein [Acidisarcina polymorpha]
MQVIQSVNGTFHHFDLARELAARGLLKRIYSSFPWHRLRREGLARQYVRTLPWVHTAAVLGERLCKLPPKMTQNLASLDMWLFDQWVSRRIEPCDVFVGLSGSALETGRTVQRRGGRYVCDRGSSHIRYYNDILKEEYQRWGVPFQAVDARVMEREEAEYAQADAISVPSNFARRTFLERGVPGVKVVQIPYGVRLDRFRRTAPPPTDGFEVLFAGSVCLRKGFPYLLEAFQMLRHPRKRLRLAGAVDALSRPVLDRMDLTNVEVLGAVSQAALAECMSTSHVMVLPSIEEGLALVQGQAMACGCP